VHHTKNTSPNTYFTQVHLVNFLLFLIVQVYSDNYILAVENIEKACFMQLKHNTKLANSAAEQRWSSA
jgi:hypothetical protein